jgi:hypothetical protein
VSAADASIAIAITTPGDWIAFDPALFTDSVSAETLLGERLEAVPELASYREELLAVCARTMARASSDGVLYTALLADLRAEREPMLGSLAVVTTPAPPPDPESPMPKLADIEERIADREPDVEQRLVQSILLPGGPALRVARVVELPLTATLRIVGLTVQYFLTVPGEDQFVILSFASPTLAAHVELQQIWHDIATSFRFVADSSQVAGPATAPATASPSAASATA